jgi:hypothetical protein
VGDQQDDKEDVLGGEYEADMNGGRTGDGGACLNMAKDLSGEEPEMGLPTDSWDMEGGERNCSCDPLLPLLLPPMRRVRLEAKSMTS